MIQAFSAARWEEPMRFSGLPLSPLISPDYLNLNWARRVGTIAAAAAKESGVERVVLISSVGAQHEVGVGPIGCLKAIESAFQEAVPNVTSLRAGSFMENFLGNVDTIAATGSIFSPHPAEKKFPIVATRDIAEKAFEALRDKSW
jgi:uncharacterized protein YbjT (DUF2867 family)